MNKELDFQKEYNYGLKIINNIKEKFKLENDLTVIYPFIYNNIFYFPILEKINEKFKLVAFQKIDGLTLKFMKEFIVKEDIFIDDYFLDNKNSINKDIIIQFGITFSKIKKIITNNSKKN